MKKHKEKTNMRVTKIILMALFMALVIYGRAIAANDGQTYHDGQWAINSTALYPVADSSEDIGTSTKAVKTIYADKFSSTVSNERTIRFNPHDFWVSNAEEVTPVSVDTKPKLAINNKMMSIVWETTGGVPSPGVRTPAQVTFVVPKDYESGGGFRAWVDESDSSTPNKVGYGVLVTSPDGTYDTVSEYQSYPYIGQNEATPGCITLAIGTDFTSLASGDLVMFGIWRNDQNPTTHGSYDSSSFYPSGQLEVYYVEFYYTSTR